MKKTFILILALFFIVSCREEKEIVNILPKSIDGLKIKKLSYTKKREEIKLTGTVIPLDGAKILSKVRGEILTIKKGEGDRVKKGELLIKIDDREYRERFKQAKFAVNETKKRIMAAKNRLDAYKAQYDLAKKTYNRFLRLKQKSVISKQKFDEVYANYISAKSSYLAVKTEINALYEQLKRAKAHLAEAKTYLDYTNIRAPFNGRILKKFVDIGDTISPGMPLMEIQYKNKYQIRCSVPESYINSIKSKDVLKTKIKNKEIMATVDRIVLLGDENSRSYEVKLTIPYYKFIKPGMYVSVYVPVRDINLLLIPKKSIVSHGQIKGIFTVDDTNIIRFRIIRTGREIDNMIEVISGVKEDERYVVNPTPDIKDGDRVILKATKNNSL